MNSEPSPSRRRWIVAIAALTAVAGGVYSCLGTHVSPFVRLEAVWKDSELKRMRPEEFERRAAADMRELAALRDGLDWIAGGLEALKKELPEDAGVMTADQRRRLKDHWATFLDHQIALDRMKGFYQAFPGVALGSGPRDAWRHARSFAAAYLIHLLQIDGSRRFIDFFIGDRDYERVLDEEDVERGIARGSYGRMKLRVVHVQTWTETRLLHRYHETLRDDDYGPFLLACPDAWIVGEIDRRYPAVKAWYDRRGVRDLAANAADIAGEDLFALWFPVQKEVSEWMGDTRVARRPPLISPEQIEALRRRLEPGDVILERHNWFLSNVGLPGFWPHAELYVGTPEELAAYAGGEPAAMDTRAATAHRGTIDGRPLRVMEAVSEGVVFSPIERACAADYVAVLRPRLPKADKLRAIAAACRLWGRPYDFNFDFITDDAIVCSELVLKAYLPDAGKRGLVLPLQEMMGRKVWPPHEFAGLYGRERGRPEAQFDFVAFLEGIEKEGRAVERGEEDFVRTYDRPKWCIAQP